MMQIIWAILVLVFLAFASYLYIKFTAVEEDGSEEDFDKTIIP